MAMPMIEHDRPMVLNPITLTLANIRWVSEMNEGFLGWKLLKTSGTQIRILAMVQSNGNWRTYDMDQEGGESGQEVDTCDAMKEAETSLKELGYL